MVQYKHAAVALLLSTTSSATSAYIAPNPSRTSTHAVSLPHVPNVSLRHHPQHLQHIQQNSRHNSRRYSAIPYDDSSKAENDNISNNIGNNIGSNIGTLVEAVEGAVEAVEGAVEEYIPQDNEREVETLLAKKEQRLQQRLRNHQLSNKTYRISLPIASPASLAKATTGQKAASSNTETLETLVAKGQEIALSNSVGMSLRQVYSSDADRNENGRRLSELALDVDTLRFQSFVDELQGRTVVKDVVDEVDEVENGAANGSANGAMAATNGSATNGSATTNGTGANGSSTTNGSATNGSSTTNGGAISLSITTNGTNGAKSANGSSSVQSSSTPNGAITTNEALGSIQVLQISSLELLRESFDGVVVSSVVVGGLAWKAGVRAGDVLVSTSATIGNKLWPKSTLDGVRSAISSRKVMSSNMEFEFRRLSSTGVVDSESIQSFELSLSRPIGINVEDTDDGYVTVTGISDKANPLVKQNLQVGDRVVSVESSFGGQMWQVYNTDGLTSAVTSRLPGQKVRIAFERLLTEDGTQGVEADQSQQQLTASSPASFDTALSSTSIPRSVLSGAVDGFRLAGEQEENTTKAKATSVAPPTATVARVQSVTSRATRTASQNMLLSRSRDLLRTYIARNEETKERGVPAKVADRVIEAVVEASAALDGRTLTLLMKAYNACGNSDKTIETFEEAFGLAGDGSDKEVVRVHEGRLTGDILALNTFTISGLLGAHAARGDYESALRILAAMDGNCDFTVNGKKARSWSGKGDPLNMLPDTRCYNIALAAAAKRGTKEGLDAALEIFESMPDPSLNNPPLGKPAKNLVTFNTMIDAYAIMGQYDGAYEIFKRLKKTKLQPNRITFTSLIKAAIKSGNLNKALDLLDDMKWVGVTPDLVSYNNIIEALCKSNRLYEAKDLVNEMERTKVSPDSMTYGLLMKGLLKANKPGPCLTLFESAFSDRRTTALTENVQLYTTAITAAAALGDHERALELVTRMNRAGVKPNKRTLTALMGACISSGRYGPAADIFSKIKNPDGYAMAVGLQALCFSGKFEDALQLLTDQRNGHKMLTGKQVMAGYTTLLQSALEAGEFSAAREALTGLLGAGYIPSKVTFRAMIEGLDLQIDAPLSSIGSRRKSPSEATGGRFEFLLFVLDSLENRKLTVDSTFYSSILILGAQDGGLHKRIAYYLSQSRNSSNQKAIPLLQSDSEIDTSSRSVSWEELLANYSDYKDELGSKILLPSVRISTRDFGRVLAAEQAVTYGGGRGNFSR